MSTLIAPKPCSKTFLLDTAAPSRAAFNRFKWAFPVPGLLTGKIKHANSRKARCRCIAALRTVRVPFGISCRRQRVRSHQPAWLPYWLARSRLSDVQGHGIGRHVRSSQRQRRRALDRAYWRESRSLGQVQCVRARFHSDGGGHVHDRSERTDARDIARISGRHREATLRAGPRQLPLLLSERARRT